MAKCKKGFEVEVCRSAAGYYLGTYDEMGCPNCRISSGYAKNYKDAQTQLKPDRQNCPENHYCNGTGNCFK